ncbi:MAG TPA: substrate-binding domain-containing protein [Dehalococcoidia bacterium]|nr:substrate-binding domain-containing protein [Dehalococcoidia bacterium]
MRCGARALRLLAGLLLAGILIACSSNSANNKNSKATNAPAATSASATVAASVQSTSAPASPAAATAASVSTSPAAAAKPKNTTLLLSTTTSTQDSGLLDVLIPLFEKQTGYQVKTAAVGSGEALKRGELGEADVLLVHSPAAELDYMSRNQGINRRLVMHNDFIIVGPASDPAHIKGMTKAVDALKAIVAAKATFISRGDNSGTNALELQLWKQAGIDPKGQSWYLESGQGMGATLTITAEKQAYTISDRATYLATRAQTQLGIVVEKDGMLLNIYHVIQVNPANHTGLNVEGARAFSEFMVSPDTQKVIAGFGVEKYGQQLFIPDAGKTDQQVQQGG